MFGYTVSDFSVWLIIAVTCERYIVVCYPLKATSICDTSRAKRVISIILLVLLVCNAHFMWTVKVVEFTHDGDVVLRCSGTAQHAFVIDHVWPWVDALFYSFLPFIVISVVNVLIVRRIVHAHRHRDDLLRSGSVTSQQRPPPQSNEGSTRMTIMLLTISFAFLLTTLPRTVTSIAAAFFNQYRRDLARVAAFEFAHTVTDLLMYVNHSMNFFLYCATGQKFRHQLIWMVCYARSSSFYRRRHNTKQKLMRKLICEPLSANNGCLGDGVVDNGGGEGKNGCDEGGMAVPVGIDVIGAACNHRSSNNSVSGGQILNACQTNNRDNQSPSHMAVRKSKGDQTEMYAMI